MGVNQRAFGQTKVLEKADSTIRMKAFIIFFCFVMYLQSAVSKYYLVKTKDSASPRRGGGGGYGGRRGSGYNYDNPTNINGNDYSNDYQGEDYPDVGRLPDTPLLPGGDSLLPPESIPGKLPDTPLLPGGDSLLPTNPPPTEQTTTRDKIGLLTGELLKAVYDGKR